MKISDRMNREAFLQISGVNDDDLIYDSTKNNYLDTVPYVLALDHRTRSIVLAIRGTLRCVISYTCSDESCITYDR